jgi:hypothetical protein
VRGVRPRERRAGERLAAYLTGEPQPGPHLFDEDEERVFMFFPRCAEQEFGPFGWEAAGEAPGAGSAG